MPSGNFRHYAYNFVQSYPIMSLLSSFDAARKYASNDIYFAIKFF